MVLAGSAAASPLFAPLAFAKGASSGSLANTAGPPSAMGIQPTYNPGNITTCPAGTTTFLNTADTGPGNQSGAFNDGGAFFNVTVNGKYISFTTNLTDYTVYVKGGPAWDTYAYAGTGITSDSGLHSPYNNGGQIAGLSHYLVCGNPNTPPPPPPIQYTLYAGYADSFRGTLPYFPTPWQGSPNVIFVGCGYGGTDTCPGAPNDLYDSGALRIDNTGTTSFTVTDASVTIGSCTFDPWSSLTPSLDQVVAPGQTLILTQTGGAPACNPEGTLTGNYNFDTSESTPVGATNICTANDGLTPSISLTIDGTATTYNDTAQVLNDQGTDPGDPSCTSKDEFRDWTPIS